MPLAPATTPFPFDFKRAAQGKKLDHHHKKVLRAVLKTIATTVAGTLALGGIAHLTAAALGQHFAIETAAKAVGKAAMYDSRIIEEEDAAALEAWIEHILKVIAAKVENLGEMSEKDLLAILEKSNEED